MRPVIDENIVKDKDKKASGKIEYINDTLETLTVTLDTQSFTVSDTGEMHYAPLASSIHVKFSASSFRILPKQSYLVFYEASADTIPSWFVVYATFAGYKETTAEGLKMSKRATLRPAAIFGGSPRRRSLSRNRTRRMFWSP